MKARLILGATAAVAALGFAGIAQAHVTVHPNALPAGGFTVVNVNVPNEQSRASTVKVTVQVPSGIFFLSTKPIPGWTAKVTYRKLAKPVKIGDDTSTEEVATVAWTGKGSLGRIGPGEFQQFPISIAVPSKPKGTVLTFKTLQTYSTGEVVRWIGSPTSDSPAPQVMVVGAKEAVQDYPAGVSAMRKLSSGAVFLLPLGLLGVAGVGVLRRHRRER